MICSKRWLRAKLTARVDINCNSQGIPPKGIPSQGSPWCYICVLPQLTLCHATGWQDDRLAGREGGRAAGRRGGGVAGHKKGAAQPGKGMQGAAGGGGDAGMESGRDWVWVGLHCGMPAMSCRSDCAIVSVMSLSWWRGYDPQQRSPDINCQNINRTILVTIIYQSY